MQGDPQKLFDVPPITSPLAMILVIRLHGKSSSGTRLPLRSRVTAWGNQTQDLP